MPNIGVEILFNGRPAKQYSKDGNLFLEAKEGSEYEIEIKNNYSYRTLVIIGVDGINVIDGQNNHTNSPGYVIERYSSLRLKGYRLSNDKVAAFKFVKKGESYASGKTINAQCGVINIQAYQEKIKQTFYNNQNNWNWVKTYDDVKITEDVFPYDIKYTCWLNNMEKSSHIENNSLLRSCSLNEVQQKPSDHFDMGSTFGQSKESKVEDVDFEKGVFLGEINIYYASRESLKEMGIPLESVNKIVFPQGVSKFCSPPSGWKE